MTLLAGALLLGVLVLLPGRPLARAWGLPRDLFAATIFGVGAVSVVGLLLARAERFSLTVLLAVLAGLAVCGAMVARRRHVDTASAEAWSATRGLAAGAAVAALLWAWPPFETVLAGSDSTMYLNAGVHLARTGSLEVTSEAVDILGERTAAGIFPSVRVDGSGPYIRLPGGLLMSEVADERALPAFFPLLPVWTAIATMAWGPEGAPVVAPLTLALAVWAVTLLAAETFGLGVGLATAVLLLANFSLWWFGRFLMPELLACAFIWSGLLLLRRDAPGAAGLMFGLAGLARAETMLFLVAAVGVWVLWERPPVSIFRLLAGFLPVSFLTGFSLLGLPSHHAAYLWNDVMLAFSRTMQGVPLGTAMILVAITVGLLAAGGVAAALRQGRLGDRTLRVFAVLGIAVMLLVYLIAGGSSDPLRSVRWLAAYCSWPLLGLALAGAAVGWRRADPVVRLVLVLAGLVAVVFIINPRVAPFHPWAIRRFLPVVIPALSLAAALAVGAMPLRGRSRGIAAALVVVGLVVLEVRPVQAIRGRWYFHDGFRTVESLAEMLPRDAFVIVDSALADVQLQVPLWLVHRRETVMMAPDSMNWRAALFAAADSRRPGYWIDSRPFQVPRADGLKFEPVVPNPDILLLLPNSGIDRPPHLTIGRRYMLRVYRITRSDA